MARIKGVLLPDDKKVDYALTTLYGIGWYSANQILNKAQIERGKKVSALTEAEIKTMSTIIEKEFTIEGDLREDIGENIKRIKEIGSYRGVRHVRGLPARGQRTRSNARTKRGKRRTVGALKKEVWAKLDQQKKQPEAGK